MRQRYFEQLNQLFWQDFEAQLQRLEKGDKTAASESFAPHYRTVCHHLALAKNRYYSGSLIEYLQDLCVRGHRILYRDRRDWLVDFVHFMRDTLPQTVRREKGVMIFAHLLFYVPLVAMVLLIHFNPDFAFKLFPWEAMGSESGFKEMAESYAKQVNRPWQDDVLMFGFYIFNNISIAFKCFAGGLMFGIGSIYTLLSNGFIIGGIMGYISTTTASRAFFSFVGAHGAFELTAIVMAGAAGLRVGLSLINPKGYRRLEALRQQGKTAGTLIGGAFVFLVIAAFLEAFWSPVTSLPMGLKYAVAAILWVWVYAYLLFSGKNKGVS